MKRAFALKWRDALGMIVFHGARVLERIFPPTLLRFVLFPIAATLAVRDTFFHYDTKTSFPHLAPKWLTRRLTPMVRFKTRIQFHLSRAISNWPDRLSEPHWLCRFKIEGNVLHEAATLKKPIILVSAHFGAMHLGGYFLRAHGFPVATFVGNVDQAQSASRRAKDRLSHFPDLPHVFSSEGSLRNVYRFLEVGNILRTAFDVRTGKLVQLPIDEGSLCFATGSIRLAAATGASLIPYVISECAPWKFVLRLGLPVPDHLLANSADMESAAAHVAKECCRFFKNSPEEAGGQLHQAFSPTQHSSELVIS